MARHLLVVFLMGSILFGANEILAIKGYAIPSQLELKILPKPDGADGEMNFEGVIKVLAGTLAKGKVTFSSSADLEVTSAPITIEGTTEGKEERFSIVVKKKEGGKAAFGTWVGFRVMYEYNVKALEKLAQDETVHPDPFLRSLLLREIREMGTRKSMEAIKDARFDFPPAGTLKDK